MDNDKIANDTLKRNECRSAPCGHDTLLVNAYGDYVCKCGQLFQMMLTLRVKEAK